MRILILDTETTGLFERGSDPKNYTCFNNSRLIELGYIVYNDSEIQKKYESLVKVDFPITNSHIHNICNIDCEIKGKHLLDVLKELHNDLLNVDVIVAHNIDFDLNIILAECYRNEFIDLINLLKSKSKKCTMKMGKEMLKLYKYPKLMELYPTLTNKEWIQQHRALDDVEKCSECYFVLMNKID